MINHRNTRDRLSPVFEAPAVFLDLETTGASPVHDRVTEIGLIEIERGRPVGEWSTLVNPQRSIPPAIQSAHRDHERNGRAAPTFAEIAPALRARLEGRLLVAHNARFDYGFLRNEFRRAGLRYASRVLCTVKLSRRLYPRETRHNLDALAARHGVACAGRHRALGDARALRRLVELWQREHGPARIAAVADGLVKAPAYPAGLPEGVLDDIPEAPGVYVFYGERDAVLYVGKSVNLRARVLAHFSGDHREARDARISRELRRVDWIETGGELGALVEEARLVKQLAPACNPPPAARRGAAFLALERAGARGGARLVGPGEIGGAGLDELHGLFRSRAAGLEALRGIAAEHGLCLILLGIEKGRGPCFAHQIRRCRGACVGKEAPIAHGLRLGQALAGLRMRAWPFTGRIGVREGSERLLVFDRWCYLGTVRSEAELRDLAEQETPSMPDPDTYRILARFLSARRDGYTVVELPPRERAADRESERR